MVRAWWAGCLALVCACATGGTRTVFDDGPGGASSSAGGANAGGSGGEAITNCTDDVQCTDYSDDCNKGRCINGTCAAVAANEQLACEDEDACTTTGTCVAGACQPGPTMDCTRLDDACGVGICDAALGCVREPANVGGPCDDGLFCTDGDVCDATGACVGTDPYDCGAPSGVCALIACDEGAAACVETPQTMCVNADGCCPSGCTLAMDDDCNCTNLALMATPSSSGGGVTTYGPAVMNDTVTEPVCAFHWINNGQTPSGAYIEYQWPSAVTIASTYIATQAATSTVCSSSGRNVFSGSVQYWNGTSYVTATTFTGQADDVVVALPTPVTTTRLRIFDMTTSPGNGNSLIYEWYVFPSAGCSP
jgi:hypothetical protein